LSQRMRRLPSSFPVEVRMVAETPLKGVVLSLPEHSTAGLDLSAVVRQEVQSFRDGRTSAEALQVAKASALRRLERVDARPELLAEEILAGLDAPDWLDAGSMEALEKLDPKQVVQILGPQLAPEKSVLLFFSPDVAPSEATSMSDGEGGK